jgi:hypothetical protein
MDHNEHAIELSPLARYAGLKTIKRHKCFLNRSVAMEICKISLSVDITSFSKLSCLFIAY